MKALLDTHAAVWALEGDPRLGVAAKSLIEASDPADLAIANMSLLEIAMLLHKGRIPSTESPELLLSETAANFNTLPLTAPIAAMAYALHLPHADPFDRVITATARVHGLKLITRDQSITESGLVETVW